MSKRRLQFSLLPAVLLVLSASLITFGAQAQQRLQPDDIRVELVDAQSGKADFFPVDQRRAYVPANLSGDGFFEIRISNDAKVPAGVIVAVDGYNVISATRSRMNAAEDMYVIDPRKTLVFRGWRTGAKRVERFRFDERWAGDPQRNIATGPAPGHISVGVFERRPLPYTKAGIAEREKLSTEQKRRLGRGNLEHGLPARIVFAPLANPIAVYSLQYMTEERLCDRGIGNCQPPQSIDSRDVTIDIIDDRQRSFPQYIADSDAQRVRAYLEAERDVNYGIRVRNRSNHRVGFVIAVDGRNIVSGDPSTLSADERMYILDPGQSAVYDGWRTDQNTVNRFYFTNAEDSYADAWGDDTALGIIAIAAFQERDFSTIEPALTSRARANKRAPGTGFGDEEYSPSRRVEFNPYQQASVRYFYNYDWRESLCQRGVIRCPTVNTISSQASSQNLRINKDQSRRAVANQYAQIAADQYDQNQQSNCGFSGPRWHDDLGRHFRWALSADDGRLQSEIDTRTEMLRGCQQQKSSSAAAISGERWHEDFAQEMVKMQRSNRRSGCNFQGLHWHEDPNRHIQFAASTDRKSATLILAQARKRLRRCRN